LKIPWHKKLYLSFLIYLPVILLLILISLIYITYIFKYLVFLIEETSFKKGSYPFLDTNDPSKSHTKGIIFLCLTLLFVINLLIALLRTIFMDPGFFPDPTCLEQKLIMKNTHNHKKPKKTIKEVRENYSTIIVDPNNEFDETNKYLFFNDFGYIINVLPLTYNEYIVLSQNMENYLGIRPRITIDSSSTKTEELKKQYKEEKPLDLQDKDKESDKLINPLEYEDIYDNFKGIDMVRLPLCNSCLRWKVERSHHCRQCGKCILKMDHHCPWLANCIGFRNYKYFCLIHIHGIIGSIFILVTFWEAVVAYSHGSSPIWEESFIIFVYICNIGLLGFLLWLFIFNVNLIYTGQTVIEQSDRERFPSSKPENIYDLGIYRNFTTVFGRNPLFWFIPFFANYEGEGIVFEISSKK